MEYAVILRCSTGSKARSRFPRGHHADQWLVNRHAVYEILHSVYYLQGNAFKGFIKFAFCEVRFNCAISNFVPKN